MRQKATIAGRSYLFNALFIFIGFAGFVCLFLGYHKAYENFSLPLKIIGFSLLTFSTTGILIFRGRLMMSHVSRAIVGTLFIVSGILKINDPVGFSYKLTEYFNEGALSYSIKTIFHVSTFSLEFLIPHAVSIAFIIALLELVIGVLLLLGGLAKTVSYVLLFLMCFFTFLTWHTAECDSSKKYLDRTVLSVANPSTQHIVSALKKNKALHLIARDSKKVVIGEWKQPVCVTDCGCFGDALKGSVGRSLTPKESFWKDILVLYLACWIFSAQWIASPNRNRQNLKYLTFYVITSISLSLLFSWYFITLFGFILLIGSLWVKRVGGRFLGTNFGSVLFVVCSGLITGVYVVRNEPLKDFRPYAVGSNLRYKMNDGKDGTYENTLVYINRKTGKMARYSATSTSYLKSRIWSNKDWRFKAMQQQEIEPTQSPSITKQFDPSIFERDLTQAELTFPPIQEMLKAHHELSLRDYIVKTKLIVLLTSVDLKHAYWDEVAAYQNLYRLCLKQHVPFICITSSDKSVVNTLRRNTHFVVPTFFNDPTELKAIARSNPSVMFIRKGVVIGKFSHRSLPSLEWIKKHLLK
jgi:uncharacterized membrane protein YphA (DoxX/SURF4 family)